MPFEQIVRRLDRNPPAKNLTDYLIHYLGARS